MKAAFLFFSVLFTISLASAQTVSIGDYSFEVDSEVTVPITINDAELIAGGVVNISFDPSIVSVREVTAGDFGSPVANINNIQGWVKIVAADINAVNKSKAVFANLIFKGFSPGQTGMNFTYASLNNELGQIIKPGVVNGSIIVRQIAVYHPYIHLKSLSSLKTVDNVKASYSIGIFNGQNTEDTFDLTVLNHNLSSVAALNQSMILIPPWESREFILNVTDETPGEYYVSVRATSKSNLSVIDEIMTKTVVLESFTVNLTSYEGSKTSIGANITYYLTLQNNQKIKDTLTLNQIGIDQSWISFDTIQELGAGEQKIIPVIISIPDTADVGSFTLSIFAVSSNLGTSRDASLPLIVQSGPVVSGLAPIDNSHLGSDDVVFSWITNMNSTTKVILNQNGTDTVYTGNEGIYHTVIVENLTRNLWYTYKVISNTSHGSTESEERTFYIDNGVTFTRRIYDFNIERDYDQRFNITVENTGDIAHVILLTVNSTNPDLIVGFVGEGSIDETIMLSPGETRDVTLALHAQDAMQKDYYLLLDLNTNESISDHAVANIHVRQPNIDLRLEEISIEPLTLTKTFRLRNYGDTVTDLNIYESGGLKGNVTFQPIITHGYMGNGGSVAFDVAPVLSLDFTGMEGDVVVEAAGVKKSFPVNFTLPEGKNVFYGSVPNVTIEFSDYFDNDNSPNTNPNEDELVESYLTNGSLIFFSQIIVDVFQDGEPVKNANITLMAWNSEEKTIILNGVSDYYGKALFAIFGKAGDYSYKAIMDNYKVETEIRNFSVDALNPLYQVYHNNITWSTISDSNSTFNNFDESIVLDNGPYFFKGTKDVIGENETFTLDLRWEFDYRKQVTIPGTIEGKNVTFNTNGIPTGNYSATIVALSNNTASLSKQINITVIDENGMQKQKNYTFWVPFPVNKTYMATLNIEYRMLSENPEIVFGINDIGMNNSNKSEYLIKYFILSNETKTENVNVTVVTSRGIIYKYLDSISVEKDVPSFINITFPINYSDETRIENFKITASIANSNLYLNVTPMIHYIYEKKIWVGAKRGVFGFWDAAYLYSSCGLGALVGAGEDVLDFWLADIEAGKVALVMTGYSVDFLSSEYWNTSKDKDLWGIAETTGSLIMNLADFQGNPLSNYLKKKAPLNFAYSSFWCLKKWYDAGVEVGIYNDIKDIGIATKYIMDNWYCTNKPLIYSFFNLIYLIKQVMSPESNIENAYLVEHFTLKKSLSSYRPHDVNLYLNNINIGSLENMIPDGHYIFKFDPSILNYAQKGTSTNIITLKTKHLNGGHYAVSSHMQVILPMNKMGVYLVAENQTEANKIIMGMSNAMRNMADIGIFTEDIHFSNSNPIAEKDIWINTTLFNMGTNDVLFTNIQILDNGAQIGENLTVDFISSMSSIPVNITWNPTPGPHTITIRINADRRIQESDYTNNEASRSITVGNAQDNIPPQSITNPSLQSAGITSLNFTWLNPTDPDFSHVMLYLNGTFKTSIQAPQNYYNFTGLQPDTIYELGTHTMDSSGNINETWVNKTARTAPISGTTYSISFKSGWNLISAPLNLTRWELGNETEVGDSLNVTPRNCISSIYRYNTTSKSFEKSDHFDNWGWWPATGSESFTKLEPGRGYWVMAQQDCTLAFTGTAPSDLDIPLNTGWNLIGWYSMNEAPLGEEVVEGNPLNVTPKNSLTSIYRYNITSGSFEKSDHFDDWGWYPATGSESFTKLEMGRGYWVMVQNEAVWRHKR